MRGALCCPGRRQSLWLQVTRSPALVPKVFVVPPRRSFTSRESKIREAWQHWWSSSYSTRIRSFAWHDLRQSLAGSKGIKYWSVILLAGLPLLVWGKTLRTRNAYDKAPADEPPKGDDDTRRTFRLAELREHGKGAERPWVMKGESVYDITDWIPAHPGGDVILTAAGGSIEPYWKIFSIHQKQEVHDILESYRIGSVDERDLVDGHVPTSSIEDPFVDDPKRDEKLHVLTERPCNAETKSADLAEFITPNRLFFVRNHMWVPTINEQSYRLVVELEDGEQMSYTIADLKRLPRASVTSTLQCSGNRRKHMTDQVKSTSGLQWDVGAIGNATWTGVRLRDILNDTGFPIADPPSTAKHAQFTGLEAYGASIPLAKAIDAKGDVLLAYEMNGSELPPDHGFPLRVVVPGHVAARSVKWLQKISISEAESHAQWQRRDYKSFGPNEGPNPDWERARSIQEMPVTSAITSISPPSFSPTQQGKEPEGRAVMEGYAYSGGGREIIRVDVSTDDGKTWDQAQLLEAEQEQEHQGSKMWCWKKWRYELPSEVEANNATLVVKATDEAYNTQPATHDPIYNMRGNLATAWHRREYRDR